MERFTNSMLASTLVLVALAVSVLPLCADEQSTLLAAPHQPPYRWFASTDPKHQNADYIALKPGETKRVPLAAGVLLRLWSTAFEPDKITMVLQNGNERMELLRANKALFGELYEKAFTLYPDQSTLASLRQLKKDAILIATNNSQQDNKWFYQVTVRPPGKVAKPVTQSAPESSERVRFDENALDNILKPAALAGEKLFTLSAGAKTGFRLYSAYGSARSQKGKPIPILKVSGAGAFVGLLLDIRPAPDTTRRTFAYLEGNEFMTADGKTYEGTGTEDYFNSAWYYPEKPFQRQYHGMPHKGFEPPRVTAYRWMVPDAVPFGKNFRFDLEHGNGNNSSDLEYRWVAYWYQNAPATFEINDSLGNASGGEASTGGASAAPSGAGVMVLVAAALAFVVLLLVAVVRGRSRPR